ncbi:DNA polymerase IV [Prosthecomicrobium hirschii]|uniref:DNA polymerase IV n=1 Tax=Prosthecodimorpha hirschii TaxID=665126 RepID=UPI00222061FE|nr:DNA polymerase IV [Prosthecomicrobium hirschii]
MLPTQNSGVEGFCRDCLVPSRPGAWRCASCGSPRLVAHPELDRLSIAHVDCDAFYASIEKRDDPSLRDVPLIVGGGKRGVVSTACYLARIHGVRSAMPMFKALAACPQAVVIKPNMEKYVKVGRQVRQLMLELTPLVEPVSIDEAFLDLSGTDRLHHATPALTLARFAKRVEDEIGITISVGLAPNKFLAKIASDFEKPRGFSVIGAAEARTFLAGQPVTLIWGVGKALAGTLERDGIRQIGQLQSMDETALMKRYGIMGQRLARLSRGDDDRRVTPDREAKSVSAEVTFDEDIAAFARLEPILRRLSEKVSARLKKAGIGGRTVTVKLKTQDFKTVTRNRRLSDPSQLADRIFRAGRELVERECDGRAFRLIGIGVTDLVPAETCDPADLVDEGAGRRAKAERAMDAVRARFGGEAVELGLIFGTDRRGRDR